ncbi:hypothetical protein [Gemmatimonas groenlandica]|uniref:Uncharacterized protein n=1 Tax=Gemmatimonas groenlandica TaxID=2732249 RepID=A0A6M4IMQ8_9BACT|nr:hypothetical protein [Gemmatimonas groenlandica]QJR35950.1 hypothetical protein HKW67_10755 [Gemmatimonas groenlandica]
MTKRVVDGLEMIDVDEDEGSLANVAPSGLLHLARSAHDGTAILDPGQGVVRGFDGECIARCSQRFVG